MLGTPKNFCALHASRTKLDGLATASNIGETFWASMLSARQILVVLLLGWACHGRAAVSLGPLFEDFKLTLDLGHRTEILGPLYYSEHRDTQWQFAVPPLFSWTEDPSVEAQEFDFLYPLLTYDRYGPEHRFQILQVFAFAGGQTQNEIQKHRFTLFPIYFQQWSADPKLNYWALVPVYGHLENRLFHDDIRFIFFPLYARTHKRDMVTDNFLYPVFHVRHGNALHGWQVWPLVGHEHKEPTTRTNALDETEIVGGHDKLFVLWPFFFNSKLGLGTENPEWQQAFLPFYSINRSPNRDSATYFWPFGLTITDDREKKFHEIGAPWPLIVFAHGEGKTTRRFWPLFSRSHNATLESDFYLWPVYKYNRYHSDPLDRARTRILLFLYSDISEKNTSTGIEATRKDFWPLYTARRDFDGNERLQFLSLLEPILPNSKSIERNYSPIWAVWRSEKNVQKGVSSQSLLWNLYRCDITPERKKCSFFFGVFQRETTAHGKSWRLFYIPMGKKKKDAE